MAIYIFTTSIKYPTGLTKATINNANLLSELDKVVIVTFFQGVQGVKHTYSDLDIPLKKGVEVVSFRDIKRQDGFDSKLGKWLKINDHYKVSYNAYDKQRLEELAEAILPTDFIIFATPFIGNIVEKSGVTFKCSNMLQVHADYNADTFNQKYFLATKDYYDYVQALTSGSKESLEKMGDLKSDKVVCISNVFTPKDKIAPLSSKNVIIGMVGTFLDRKNQKALIPIAKKLRGYDVTFNCYGNPSGEYYNEFVELINKNSLQDMIVIRGLVDEKDVYEEIDCLIALAKSEGQSLVLLESTAYKKTIISNDAKYGSEDMVLDGVNGIRVKEKSWFKNGKIVKFIKSIIEDRSLLDKYGNEGFKIYNRIAAPEVVLETYKDVLDKSSWQPGEKNAFVESEKRYRTPQEEVKLIVNGNKIELHVVDAIEQLYYISGYDTFNLIEKTNGKFEVDTELCDVNSLAIAYKENGVGRYLCTLFKKDNEYKLRKIHYYYDEYINVEAFKEQYMTDSRHVYLFFDYSKRVDYVLDEKGESVKFQVTQIEYDNYCFPVISIENKGGSNYKIVYLDDQEKLVKIM